MAAFKLTKDSTLSRHILFTLYILAVLISVASSAIIKEADCSRHGKVFRRLSTTVYKCEGGYRNFECYPGHAIPPWVTLAKADPCVCMERSHGGRKELLCPNPPALNEDILPKDNNSRIVIRDTGCPGAPFFRYTRTFRTALPASYFITLKNMKRFIGPQEECKYKCLVDAKCIGVQYGPTGYGHTGKCTAFRALPEAASEFSPNEHFNYFWRVKCRGEPEGRQGMISMGQTEVPETTIPPPVTRPTPFPGLLLRNTHQMGGYLNGTGISEKECYAKCTKMAKCEAADYHKLLRQCWLHHKTTCYSHKKSYRKCCNHYKKNILTCKTIITFA